jgi:mono/diheme cytochrome c family protein
MYKVWISAAIGLLAIVGLVGCASSGSNSSQTGSAGDGSSQPLDQAQVERDQAVYQSSCAQCHGANGEGDPLWQQRNPDGTYRPPPHDPSGHTWHHSDGILFKVVQGGGAVYESSNFQSRMPAFGEHRDSEEIKDVITYIKSLWGSSERASQAKISQEDPFP